MTKPVIVTRIAKGSPLTYVEGDANFTNLQNATFAVTDGVTTITNDLNSAMTLVAGANMTFSLNNTTKTLQIDSTAADSRILVYNDTGTLLPKGAVVRITGAQGANPTVALAQATSDPLSAGTVGFVYADINNGSTGYVQTSGVIKNINTLGFTEGMLVYLSAATAGQWTQAKPTAPNHLVVLGWLTRAHANAGSIQIRVDNGYELEELHNVSNATPTNGQILKYNGTSLVWEPATEYSYTLPTATASVLGGIKIGSGLTIDGNGVVTAAGTYTLPIATASALGGIKIGSGLSIDAQGVVTASGGGGGAGETFNPFLLAGM
jgi:hypothetical protein